MIQISAQRQAILTEFLVLFLSTSTKIPGYNLELGHDRFLLYPFEFIYHPITRRYII
jgi:hypothetical protein